MEGVKITAADVAPYTFSFLYLTLVSNWWSRGQKKNKNLYTDKRIRSLIHRRNGGLAADQIFPRFAELCVLVSYTAAR